MITSRLELADTQLDSPLGRTSPLVKLAIALLWLLGLAFTLDPLPPLIVALAALVAGIVLGSIAPGTFARALAPLWLAALTVGLSNMLWSVSNGDPAAVELVRVGPIRIAEQAAATGLALVLRVAAIACVGAVFALTTDSTRLADALVQQARLPARFAYGALAAYQSIPRFAEDLQTLRQARRIRGLRGGWHPRLLVGLLVSAIRHGDRLALSMDARGFGSGQRTAYRIVRWSALDAGVGLAAIAVLALAMSVAG